jgi:uncharacterized protein YlzI (FlbEa/FlbD family)
MMCPIELTRVLENGKTERFFVNADHIVSFCGGWKGVGSYVTLTAGGTYSVRESVPQIIDRLADHRSTIRAEAHDGVEDWR